MTNERMQVNLVLLPVTQLSRNTLQRLVSALIVVLMNIFALMLFQEMAPDKIVSEAAYVLFYRRRRLTPSNVINMTI